MREKQPGIQNSISAHLGAFTSSESKVSDWENPRDGVMKGGIVVCRGGIFNYGEQKEIKHCRSCCVFSTQCVSIAERLRSKARYYTINSVIDSKLAFLSLICH